MRARVLIVDEHPVVRLGYRQILEAEGIEVFEAQNSADAIRTCAERRPDATLVDCAIRRASGLDGVRALLEAHSAVRIVVIGMPGDHAFAALALESGAKGFIRKDEPPSEIALAVKTVAAGGRYLSSEFVVDVAVNKASGSAQPRRITEREAEVIRMIAHGRSMSEVAADLQISYRTVANACNSLRCKLNARTQTEMVRLAVMIGIC